MAHIKDLAAEYGIPFELLFRPTNTPVGTVEADMESESESETDMGEDEPPEVEEPKQLDEPNS
jgi:hypothetical protein